MTQFNLQPRLNFSNTNPVPLSGGKTYTHEGVANVSDVNGNLLFYTDGITVWNRLNQVMQNGTGLFGSNSSTQAAVIVPQPDNDSVYFVFTTDSYENFFTTPKGLNYSTVNMNAAGGFGAVVIKNNLLVNPTSEKLCAVKHCNNRDIWILTRPYNTNNFYAWLLSPAGLSSPVISVSPNFVGGTDGYYAQGHLKVSLDTKRIAAGFTSTPYFELGEFNNGTGIVSNILNINSYPPFTFPHIGYTNVYGMEFSPDNQLLYTSNWTVPSTVGIASIVQYKIATSDAATIAQSAYIVDTSTQKLFYALQIAPDGKIYTPKFLASYLHVVNAPNVQGSGCNFLLNAVNLGSDTAMCGLPPLIQVPGSIQQCNVIPVTMMHFTAQLLENKVLLNWQTAIEINGKGYEIQLEIPT